MVVTSVSDEQWQAIINNDLSYDTQFWYGVHSTKIVCRPSCRSRTPRRDGITIYDNIQLALAQGYRSCKRCKPEGITVPQQQWIDSVQLWIDEHLHEQLTLSKIATHNHSSPYHLQRVFKQQLGISPNGYIQQQRMKEAAQLLVTTKLSVTAIGEQVGMENATYFNTLFTKIMGISPLQYRKNQCGKIQNDGKRI
ncbi:bifunctional transcriptional activator/DNA repair enzyme AdaA [Paenibacillus endoradicis]|uniref:bifunctional transcriptional activator/DNA repair enzyme AdaA n=1 Tax=Paenibacillus endoradicis TaxID=2972487 RepID=UPI002158F1DC|nr:Ada metal-binding domain-containing protein [Paenibacillus endoradicis]MCR8660103.1 helix-turn-helix domain-containing protein [Paenibacillus endoradicis]